MIKSDKLFDFIGKALESDCSIDSLEDDLGKNFGETCAMLMLDSTGFTRATKVLGAAYFLSIIYQLRQACEGICNRSGAIQYRAYADNFYAEFTSVDDAVAAAFAIHKYFNEKGFNYLHTPIITASDAEGAGQMFRVSTLDPINPPLTEEGGIDHSQDFFGKGLIYPHVRHDLITVEAWTSKKEQEFLESQLA